MKHIVAVEDTLGNVKDVFQGRGYQVASLDSLDQAAVAVISGMKKNVLGDHTRKRPIIVDASGLTENEIVDEVERAMKVHYEH